MKGKIVCMMMTLCMVTALVAGCGNSEGSTSGSGGSEAKDSSQSSDRSDGDSGANSSGASGDTQEADAGSGAAASDEDMSDINMVIISMSSIPSGLSAVEDAINDITEAKINTHVNIEMIEVGNYEQQVGLKLSSGETTDLLVTLPTGSASFSVMASQGQLMDITDLLSEYGQETLDTVGDLLNATTLNGAVYGVPTYRSMVTSTYISMRTDVLEDLGLLEKARNMTTFTEYEEILEAVKNSEKWNYLAGIVAVGDGEILAKPGTFQGVDAFADATVFDQLGDLNKLICIPTDGSTTTIENYFETEEYRAMYDKVKSWYEKGYIYKDSNTTNESGSNLVKSNAAFSSIISSEIGVEASQTSACGYDMTCVKIATQPVSTSSCQKFVWAVPSTSAEPEAAVKMMNLMYTDAQIANLLAWGIEDVNYVVKDGLACFVDGESADNAAYHTVDFLYGNQFLVYPWEGSDADLREQAMEEMNEAPVSEFLGFSCDTSELSTALSSIINTLNEYRPSVESGMASGEDFTAFLEKLQASGVSEVIAAYQEQLDAWLESR